MASAFLVTWMICVWFCRTTLGFATKSTKSMTRSYCNWETFNVTCAKDSVIIIEKAKYGRMKFGKCVKEDHGHIGCFANVKDVLNARCSGRRSCLLKFPDEELQQAKRCPRELLKYLEVQHRCQRVVPGQHCSQPRQLPAPPSDGYLSSVVAWTQGSGSRHCPWILETTPGKKFNISVFDFGAGAPYEGACRTYGQLRDGLRRVNLTRCSTVKQLLYQTVHHRVTIHLYTKHLNAEFLIRYQATGCADIRTGANSLVHRSGNNLMVRCNLTEETFYLTCVGGAWVGEFSNCTTGASWKKIGDYDGAARKARFPYGILMVVGIGVAVGVALGILMLMSLLLCIRKHREARQRHHTSAPLLSDAGHELVEDNISGLYVRKVDINTPVSAAHIDGCTAMPLSAPLLQSYGVYHTPCGASAQHLDCTCEDQMGTSFITFKPDNTRLGKTDRQTADVCLAASQTLDRRPTALAASSCPVNHQTLDSRHSTASAVSQSSCQLTASSQTLDSCRTVNVPLDLLHCSCTEQQHYNDRTSIYSKPIGTVKVKDDNKSTSGNVVCKKTTTAS